MGAIDGTGLTNYVARFTDADSLGTGVIWDDSTNVGIGLTNPEALFDVNSTLYVIAAGNVGIGTTLPGYALEVIGDIGIVSSSDLYIGTIGLSDVGADETDSGASLVGVFDEFTYSSSSNVQDVLDDLDFGLENVAGGTHPVVTIASGLDYASIDIPTQVLTLNQIDLTTDVTDTLGVSNGGTGTATLFAQGSLVFAGASGIYTSDSPNLFWDDSSDYLGIGTSAPQSLFDVTSSFFVDSTGNVGIGSTAIGTLLSVGTANQFQVDSSESASVNLAT